MRHRTNCGGLRVRIRVEGICVIDTQHYRDKYGPTKWWENTLLSASIDINTLCDRIDELEAATQRARHELGVPGDGYPMPVANAVGILREAEHD